VLMNFNITTYLSPGYQARWCSPWRRELSVIIIRPIRHVRTKLLFQAMDVSADLQELARCPVGLVCAGVKSILDIGR